MTSYFNACDVTVANSNHKNFLQFFDMHLCPPTLKKVPLPMPLLKVQTENVEPLLLGEALLDRILRFTGSSKFC